MGTFDAFRYDGKRALVVGGATGMGAAVAELVKDAGAEVVVMDRAEVALPGVKAIHLDLSDKASIDAAVEECGGPIHALFSCAGAADGTPGIEKINFIGHRHLIDRAVQKGHLGRGGAIAMISSTAGRSRSCPPILPPSRSWLSISPGDPIPANSSSRVPAAVWFSIRRKMAARHGAGRTFSRSSSSAIRQARSSCARAIRLIRSTWCGLDS